MLSPVKGFLAVRRFGTRRAVSAAGGRRRGAAAPGDVQGAERPLPITQPIAGLRPPGSNHRAPAGPEARPGGDDPRATLLSDDGPTEVEAVSRRAFLAKAAATGAAALGSALLPRVPSLAASVTIRSRRDGPWNAASTWNRGRVPNRRDVVGIEHVVTVRGAARVRGAKVSRSGALVFDPERDVTFRSTGNVIVRGRLWMEPADAGVTHILRFIRVRERRFRGGGMRPIDSDVGLWVMGRGRLDARGTTRQGWLRAASGLAAGTRQVPLQTTPTGWRAGDQVVVVPTRQGDYTGFEVRTIAAIQGATVTLSSALSRNHPAVEGSTAEVANLTRNVRIEGTASGRTHVFIHSSRTQTIRYTAIRHVGPRNRGFVRGRYGLHFHRMGSDSRDSIVEGVVVRDSGSHSFVPHASHGITFRDCVAYNVRKDAYWWDHDRGFRLADRSLDVTFQRSLAARVRGYGSEDSRLSGFVLSWGNRENHPTNTCVDCVAVGVVGSKNSNGFNWPGSVAIWEFRGNVAHNNERLGIFVWDNSSPAFAHDIVGFTAYHCGRAGILHGAYRNEYHYRDITLVGPGAGVLMWANPGRRETREVVWDNVRIRGASVGIEFSDHNLPAEGVGQLSNWRLDGVDRPIVVNERGEYGGRFDLVAWQIDGRQPDRAEHVTVLATRRDTCIRALSSAEATPLFTIGGGCS